MDLDRLSWQPYVDGSSHETPSFEYERRAGRTAGQAHAESTLLIRRPIGCRT